MPDVSRREFIKVGGLTIGVSAFASLLARQAEAQAAGAPPGRAKAVIQLWMSGGPPHIDTFDPKPDAGEDYCGPLRRPLATNADGVRIGELLPVMAKQADKYTLLRSYTHGNNGHETATYIVQTGTLPSVDLVYPAMGAVVSLKKGYEGGYKGVLPPYITLTSPLGRFSEAGFLGNEHKTYATGGDPVSKDFSVEEIVPPRWMTDKRLGERKGLLRAMDALAARADLDPTMAELDGYQQKAFSLILGEARSAFDLNSEPDELRNRYGRNRFGQSCLLARRLVERGVPFVTVNMGGWDTHTSHFERMKEMLPVLDAGFGTLLADLAQHGLLESTIVMWNGEFGRTPKVATEPPWNGGRHHFGEVFTTVVAGGGFKGGQVVGSTDGRAEKVASRPVYPWDLTASMYRLLGIDPLGKLPHPQGCIAYVTPLAAGDVPSGGPLTEIM
ncbi:MAG: DUF1501 domain-containing protein [Armatimonadetes bacterium]|nr:DUF1501 domain-containing protein [Armatimonadota bacterium]